jgi:glycosyltransferase involved in cell wall biosynthesis
MQIDIVIAVYNGEQYISEQLRSITESTGYDKIQKIIVTDDNSSDRTMEIIAKLNIPKVEVVKNNPSLSGPSYNFINGLKFTVSDYVFFCDQDDFWLPDRIAKYCQLIPQLKPKYPGIIYSDLLVVDSDLNTINGSFYAHENISKKWGKELNNLWLQNCSPGCTMLLNRSAKNKLIETYSSSAIMHDWWVFLYASLYRNALFLDQTTLMYRQHDNNAVGASRGFKLIALFKKHKASKTNLNKAFAQARAFLLSLSDVELKRLTAREKKSLLFFTTLQSSSLVTRALFCLRSKKVKSSGLKSFYTKVLILLRE